MGPLFVILGLFLLAGWTAQQVNDAEKAREEYAMQREYARREGEILRHMREEAERQRREYEQRLREYEDRLSGR